MTKTLAHTCAAVLLALGWTTVGCGDSETTTTSTTPEPASSMSESSTPSSPPSSTPSTSSGEGALAEAQKAAGETLASAQEKVSEWTTQLTESVKAQSDATATELAQDLTAKIKEFSASLSGSDSEDASITEKLKSAVESLSQGDDAESLGPLQQIKEAKLTTEQSELMTEVQNVWSALVVQRNFSSLSSDGEVGNIVTALKSGDTAMAMTHLKSLSSKATLSTEQKDLVNSLVNQYAPGLKDAGQAVSDGIKKLNPFGQD